MPAYVATVGVHNALHVGLVARRAGRRRRRPGRGQMLIEQRLILEVAAFPGHAELKVLPPLCPLAVSSADFGHAGELVERAHGATGHWLDSGGPALRAPERFLSLHHHRPVDAEKIDSD